MLEITDHNSLVRSLGVASVAATLGIPAGTVRAWKPRNRIPTEYWPLVITLAAANGTLITAEWLLSRLPKRATPQTLASQVAA